MTQTKGTFRFGLGVLLGLVGLTWAVSAEAQWGPPAQPVPGGRQIHVYATPPGVRVRLDTRYNLQLAPFTFQTSPGMHTLVLGGRGHERINVPVDLSSQDLLVNVRMSRPVFEAGIALTAIGASFLVAGVVMLALRGAEVSDRRDALQRSWDTAEPSTLAYATFEEYYDHECEWSGGGCDFMDDEWGLIGTALTAVAGAFLIPGVLMAALDRQHDPTYTVGPR